MSNSSTALARIVVLLLAAALFLSGCGSSADSAAADEDAPRQHGGTIVVGMDQEPQCMNRLIQCGSLTATVMIWELIFDPMFGWNPDGTYAPLIALEVPTRENGLVVETPEGGMVVTIHLDPKARWSDGKPITCEDAKFLVDMHQDERWQIISRDGWDLITQVDCPDPQTVVYHWEKKVGKYLDVLATYPMPKHVLDGKDFNTYFNESINVASGPFMFDDWDRSVHVTLKRNPNYWNAGKDDKPFLDKVRYIFVGDTNTLKIQLRTGEVDVISPPPDSTLSEELKTFPRSKFLVEPSVYWEQIAFNTAKAPTNDVNVRQAIARSIDREEIVDIVLKGQVGVLQSTILPAQGEFFTPAWESVKPDDKEAQRLLEKAGYAKDGAYYAKGGTPLTVVFKTTAGNVLRQKVAQLLQQRLKKNGIKMEIATEPAAVFFGQSAIQGNFHMALWAWSSKPDPSQTTLFHCSQIPTEANKFSGQNNYRYCNEEVSELMKKSDQTLEMAERYEIVQEVQRKMVADMPVLPLYQRPDTLAFSNRTQGMELNPMGGLVWNVADWAVTS